MKTAAEYLESIRRRVVRLTENWTEDQADSWAKRLTRTQVIVLEVARVFVEESSAKLRRTARVNNWTFEKIWDTVLPGDREQFGGYDSADFGKPWPELDK